MAAPQSRSYRPFTLCSRVSIRYVLPHVSRALFSSSRARTQNQNEWNGTHPASSWNDEPMPSCPSLFSPKANTPARVYVQHQGVVVGERGGGGERGRWGQRDASDELVVDRIGDVVGFGFVVVVVVVQVAPPSQFASLSTSPRVGDAVTGDGSRMGASSRHDTDVKVRGGWHQRGCVYGVLTCLERRERERDGKGGAVQKYSSG